MTYHKTKKNIFTSIWGAVVLGIAVLLVDGLTKYLTQEQLPLVYRESIVFPYGGIAVFKDFLGIEFSIVHATNKGAAWGAFADYQQELLFIRIVLVAGLIIYAFKSAAGYSTLRLPIALIIAGAIGNILDAFFYGHVIDMLHFVFWGHVFPTFNVADSSICIGIFSVFALSFFEQSPQKVL